MFAPGALSGRVALVTGGGTNLGKAAAAELVRCGASVVIAGRRADVLEADGGRVGGGVLVCRRRHPRARGAPTRSSPRRWSATAGSTCCSTTPAASTSSPPRGSPPRAGTRSRGSTSAGRSAMCEAAYELAMREAGRDDRQRDRLAAPRHSRDGSHRRGPGGGGGADAGAGRALGRRRGLGDRDRARAAGDRVAAQVPGRAVARGPPSRCRSSVWARWRSTAGWWRCWPRRWAARCRGRWSRSTGRWTTGPVRGRPADLARDGEVPTEERARRRRGRHEPPRIRANDRRTRGRSVVVAQKPSKLLGRVRFPSPAWRARGRRRGAGDGPEPAGLAARLSSATTGSGAVW